MAGDPVVEVRLPEGIELSGEERARLQGMLDAFVALHCEEAGQARQLERELERDGWGVRSRIMWVARATRGGEQEEVTGESKAAALRHLQDLIRADRVLSAP
jgi:hypothetical protein